MAPSVRYHDNCMSKQFVNDVVSIAILATSWHEVPMPPLEGEVPNEREAEGFVRKLSKKTPQSARSGCQLPFQGSQGGFAARVANLATPTNSKIFGDFHSTNRSVAWVSGG